jgi:hypothetical protein
MYRVTYVAVIGCKIRIFFLDLMYRVRYVAVIGYKNCIFPWFDVQGDIRRCDWLGKIHFPLV